MYPFLLSCLLGKIANLYFWKCDNDADIGELDLKECQDTRHVAFCSYHFSKLNSFQNRHEVNEEKSSEALKYLLQIHFSKSLATSTDSEYQRISVQIDI